MLDPQTSKASDSSLPPRALEGIRVLDLSHALAGPYCTLLLSDYGAEVYKLESPKGGELSRGWGPPFVGEQAAFFLGLNRGKRGIAIDLKQPAGRDLCLRLITKMDVLIENFRPGTMDRLGLGYASVQALNPQLVYCSISGYGQNGPSRDESAMDLTVECSSGYMSITGTQDGEVVRSGYAVCDINAGLFAAIGILMALRHRDRNGAGQFVDISMFDGMISAMSSNYMTYLGSGIVPGPLGTAFPTVVPYRVFHAKDGDFSISVGSEKLWAAFCSAIGQSQLSLHPDYATNALRIKNRVALEQLLSQVFERQSRDQWLEKLGLAGIPCSPVRTFAEVVEHPQSIFREMFPLVEHGCGNACRVTGPPIKMSETPPQAAAKAPSVGEHTKQVLTNLLGLSEPTLSGLTAKGTIAT